MSPYLQQILHEITLKLTELEAKNRMLESECAALRDQINELQ
jgi:hypothetical protein